MNCFIVIDDNKDGKHIGCLLKGDRISDTPLHWALRLFRHLGTLTQRLPGPGTSAGTSMIEVCF